MVQLDKVLGHYLHQVSQIARKSMACLGPAPDIGPAMCVKILTDTGHVLYRSTYRPITEDEMNDPAEKKLRQTLDENILKKIGNPVDMDEITHIDPEATMPEYEPYDDEVHKPIPDINEVTPEEFDNYIGAEVKLPLG
jgi:hypothetical protein